MWTLANHPRMPASVRSAVSNWGLCRDEFVAGGGWQEQLYIREARRMVGDFVMTQNHCQGNAPVSASVGMGAYTMDSHHVQRYVDANGHVRNEGDVEVGGFPPYPIDYGAIVPKASECENLLVPVCLSASHMAFGSIRMEPVFMVLGQSAATAAAFAIDDDVAVQDVEYGKLSTQLLADEQVLIIGDDPPPPPPPVEDGIIEPSGATATSTIDTTRTIDKTIDSSGLSGGGASGDILTETHLRTLNGDGTQNHYWISAKDPVDLELVFDLDGLYAIDSIHQWMHDNDGGANNRGLKTFDISFSNDGGATYFSAIEAATLGDFTMAPTTVGKEPAQTKAITGPASGANTIKLSNISNFGNDYYGLLEIRFGGTLIPE